MNKVIVTMIAIVVVIGAIITAIAIFGFDQKQEVPNVVTQMSEEEILDDCTDEYEVLKEQMIKANSQEETLSPNCSLTMETHYLKCGHTTSKYSDLPSALVNLTKEELQKQYPECEIKSFASNEVILYQEKEGECNEHYLVKNKDGMVAIYQILEDGSQIEQEITGVSIEYLPETDKINMQNGIRVNGKQNLNQLIEDFE